MAVRISVRIVNANKTNIKFAKPWTSTKPSLKNNATKLIALFIMVAPPTGFDLEHRDH